MLFSVQALREMTAESGFNILHLQSNGLDIDTLLRLNGMEGPNEAITRIQRAVDDSMCGDLLRGFWTKEV